MKTIILTKPEGITDCFLTPGQRDYLGDGVYVGFDGYSIWLRTNDHLKPTDEICIEPNVLKKLIQFAKRKGILKEGELTWNY